MFYKNDVDKPYLLILGNYNIIIRWMYNNYFRSNHAIEYLQKRASCLQIKEAPAVKKRQELLHKIVGKSTLTLKEDIKLCTELVVVFITADYFYIVEPYRGKRVFGRHVMNAITNALLISLQRDIISHDGV